MKITNSNRLSDNARRLELSVITALTVESPRFP